jgi:hypothetical protein
MGEVTTWSESHCRKFCAKESLGRQVNLVDVKGIGQRLGYIFVSIMVDKTDLPSISIIILI